MNFSSKVEQRLANTRKIITGITEDVRIIIIKLADRLHNMRTLKYLTRERQIANAKETMELYAPLANRLGIYSLKWELEDLSFRYLHEEDYYSLVKQIAEKNGVAPELIATITSDERRTEDASDMVEVKSEKGKCTSLLYFEKTPAGIKYNRSTETVIYDLTGRRVNEITKAGVYIVNGRKVMVK